MGCLLMGLQVGGKKLNETKKVDRMKKKSFGKIYLLSFYLITKKTILKDVKQKMFNHFEEYPMDWFSGGRGSVEIVEDTGVSAVISDVFEAN